MRRLPFIAAVAAAVLAAAGAHAYSDTRLVTWLAVSNGATPFQGDNRLLTTVSPNHDGFRERAIVHFVLSREATVTLGVYTTRVKLMRKVWGVSGRFSAGLHKVIWQPPQATSARTYLVRVTAEGGGMKATYGSATSWGSYALPGPVVRVQSVGAHFALRSYTPGSLARLVVASDAPALTMQVFRSGWEARRSYSSREMRGAIVTDPIAYPWHHRRAPGSIWLRVGDWPSGLYFAELVAPDGRVGFAPFVVTPNHLGAARVAIIIPTNTWQAYDFWDGDGNGYGDTWYAGSGDHTIVLSRPFLDDGVPPHFSSYDLGFVRWLGRHALQPDFLSDDDLGRVRTAAALTRAYDLIVFPGHEEYVTNHVYDLIRGYRNRGGNLMFLSADNFYWRVVRRGDTLTRTASFRSLHKPEAGLVGVQYRAHKNRLGCYSVIHASAVPWLFSGTTLHDGSRLCHYGIEVDAVAPSTPPGTHVIARIPNLFGKGRSGAMTYYETARGAKVFAAGSLNFGGAAGSATVNAMLTNLWSRLSNP